MHIWKHFKLISSHRWLVMKGCFRVGLYRQGLMHDLSKYSPVEFWNGCRYFQGDASPNNQERKDRGYSSAWLHHKGRNKHHLEYWIDYNLDRSAEMPLVGMRMPNRYIVEMFVDRVAASMIYNGDKYTDRTPLEYYLRAKPYNEKLLHPEVREILERLLLKLAKEGRDAAFEYARTVILHKKPSKRTI